MGSSRLRIGLVVAAAATMVLGVIAVPSVAQAAVIKPTGLSPNDPNAAPTSANPGTKIKNVVLSWSAVTGASSYQVQVSDENGNFVKPSIDVTTTTTRFAPSSKLYHADYAWRVRATGGTWSDLAYFTRGWSAAPTGAVVNDDAGGPVLTWNALADSSFYEVQFSPRPFVQGTDPVDGGDGGEDGKAIMSCFTASNVFTPYVARSGDDDGIVEGVTVKCNELVGGPFYWRVRGRDGVFDPANIDIKAPSQSCAGVYYSKTAATTESAAECSAWGYPAVTSFTVSSHVGITLPDQVVGTDVAPRDGDDSDPVVISSNPVFSWTPDPEASFYRVYETRDPESAEWDHVWETTATKLAPVIQEDDTPNGRTSWRVQACVATGTDANGFILNYKGDDTIGVACGTLSEWRIYRKETPPITQTGPVTTVAGGHTFTWATAADFTKPNGLAVRVGDVQGYEVQISDNYGSFDNAPLSFKFDRQGTVAGQSSATIPNAGLPSGYKWRVRGIDSSNTEFPWSEPSAQTVGTLASARGYLTSTSIPALRSPVDFGFNAPVDGVSSGTARIVAESNGAVFPGTVSTVTGTTYRFNPSANWVAGERYRLQLSTAVQTASTSVPAVAGTNSIRAYTTVDSASAALTKVTGDYGWTTMKASDAYGKTYLRSGDKKSTSKRSYVQTRVRGSKVYVYGCVGPSSGKAGIYVDGSRKATVSLYKKYSDCGKVATITLSSSSAHTVKFAPLGTKVKKSSSTNVRFDRLTVA